MITGVLLLLSNALAFQGTFHRQPRPSRLRSTPCSGEKTTVTAEFSTWLNEKRREAAEAGPESGLAVIDAGEDVDNSFSFSGVTWQILSDVSTNCFGTGEVEVVVNFPGLRAKGSDIFVMLAEMFASVKNKGGLVELDRLEVNPPRKGFPKPYQKVLWVFTVQSDCSLDFTFVPVEPLNNCLGPRSSCTWPCPHPAGPPSSLRG